MELAQEHPRTYFNQNGMVVVSDVPYDYYYIYLIFGQDTNRHYNIAFLSNDIAVYASGNTLNALNMKDKVIRQLYQNSTHGVLCCCADPGNRYVAVGYSAEYASFKIYSIYSGAQDDAQNIEVTPSIYLSQVLEIKTPSKNGVEVIRFSNDSKLIALVTNHPDYFLYIYELETGHLFLKQRAFSYLVSQITFTKYSANTILTGGRYHFKQWQMADTFTGSKLRGELAKFGVLDASDTTAFIELPCGNFLSGQCSQGGEIALWDQSNVKYIFKGCHPGGIQFMQLDVDGVFYYGDEGLKLQQLNEARGVPLPSDNWGGAALPLIVTGGNDGYIKFWSGHELMNAQFVEQDEYSIYYNIRPVHEIYLGYNVVPRYMQLSPARDICLIADSGLGGFISLNLSTFEVSRLTYGLGSVSSMTFVNSNSNIYQVNDMSNNNYIRNALVAAVGQSGTVFVFDCFNKKLVNITTSLNQKATKIQFIYNGLCLVVGFSDGTVNFYSCMFQEAGSERFVYLINQFKAFNEEVIDISASSKGDVAVLGRGGSCFIFYTYLTLVKKEEDSGGQGVDAKLSEIGNYMVQVTVYSVFKDDEARQHAEIMRRNARGKIGIVSEAIQPIGYFELDNKDKYCKLQYISENYLLFAISGCYRKENRLLIVDLPTCQEVINYRNSDPEQALYSTLDGYEAQSVISYNITHMITNYRYVNIFVPPHKLPIKLEKTVSKVEFQVTNDKISALLPQKNAMYSIDELEEPPAEPSVEQGEEENEDGVDGEKKPKQQKKRINDPLDEDTNYSILFDFRYIRATSSKYQTQTEMDEFYLVCLLDVIPPPEIKVRADNAMDVIKQRAEYAAAGYYINTSMQEDPATLCAALAVAELRAAYRSYLVYIFNLSYIQANQTVQPVVQGEINTNHVIDQELLPEDVCDDEKQRVDIRESCRIVLDRPECAYVLAEQNLAVYLEDYTAYASLQTVLYNDYFPFGSVIASLRSGQFYVQNYDTHSDFEALANETAANKKMFRYYRYNFAYSITTMEVGLGGHIIAVGDSSGCVYILFSKQFDTFTRFSYNYTSKRDNIYSPDDIWTNTQYNIYINRQFTFKDEVVSLVSKDLKQLNKGKINQQPLEIEDKVIANTIEEERLISLDYLDNKRGLTAKQYMVNKIKLLRDRFETIYRRNAYQPPDHRLKIDEISPDLILSYIWLRREWERAQYIVQIEVGEMFNVVIAEIMQLYDVFDSQKAKLTVYYFNRAFSKVSTFKNPRLPKDFTEYLCAVLGIETLEDLEALYLKPANSMEEFIANYSAVLERYNLSYMSNRSKEVEDELNELADSKKIAAASAGEYSLTKKRRYTAPIPKKGYKVLRPVDKIIQYVLTGIKRDDTPVSDQENKYKRVMERAALRKEKRGILASLMDRHEKLPAIDEGDQAVLDLLYKTIGTFIFKYDINYVEMISKLVEDAEKLGYNDLINQNENKETKYLHFLLTMKAMDEAKTAFNEKVCKLFDQKVFIVQICSKLKENCLFISSLLKQKLGPYIYNEVEYMLTYSYPEEAFIDEIFNFVKLTREEELYLVRMKLWDEFVQFYRYFQGQKSIEAYQHRPFSLFNISDCDVLIIEYINQCLQEKLISSDEANKLNQLINQCKPLQGQREAVLTPYEYVIAEVNSIFESEGVDVEYTANDSEPTASKKQSSESNTKGEQGHATRSAVHAFVVLLMQAQMGVAVQQTNTYDPTNLISLFDKQPLNKFYKEGVAYYVSLLISIRRYIISRIGSLVEAFDDCFNELLNEYVVLYADFCKMYSRLITLFQECEIHHLYIKKDQNCIEKLDMCRNDRKNVSYYYEKLLQYINQKAAEAKEICAVLRDLQEKFNSTVPDGVFKQKLFKMYNKKVKKIKVKQQKYDDDNNNVLVNPIAAEYLDDDEDDSSDLSDESDISSDSEEIDETKPPEDCDPEIFNAVLMLRYEKREKDAKLYQIELQSEYLRLQALNLSKKEKQIVASIDAAKNELTTFRTSKQQELNNIQTSAVVDLRSYNSLIGAPSTANDEMGNHSALFNQIYAMNTDLSNSLLFNKDMFYYLYERIDRRSEEIRLVADTTKYLLDAEKRQKNNLKFRNREFDEYNKKLVAIYNLKFGRQVDIEKLDSVVVNEEVKKLQQYYDDGEKYFNKELTKNQMLQERELDKFSEVIKENTRLVMKLKQMESKGLNLDKAIINRYKQPPKAWCNDNRYELVRQEYNNLKYAIVDRERELKSLVDEISVLKNHNMK